MQNNNTHISVPVKGMNTDVHPANLSEQGYDFAQNAVVEEFTGNGLPLLQNEGSNLLCANWPTDYRVVGFVNIIEQDRKVLFLVNPITGFSQIGEIIGYSDCDGSLKDPEGSCDDCGSTTTPLENRSLPACCTYNVIATQSCFNFSIDHPIRATYRLENCGLSIYFTDNHNPYRYIEFDYLNEDSSSSLIVKDKFKVVTGFDNTCNAPIYGSQIDCNKLLIDPVVDIPCLELVDVLSGGTLKAGVYQFLFSYADKDGSKLSPYYYATNPIPVFSRTTTFDTDYITDKAIQVRVNNITINTPHEYYQIAVAKTINNVTSFEHVGVYPITQTTFTYSGNDKSLKDLTPNDIFEQKVFYGKAKIIGTSNNYLFFGGLEETKKLNVQRIANNVKLQWQTIAIPEPVYRHPRFINKFRSYLRDEVYSFGIILIFNTGEESIVGHIPGRTATNDDLSTVTGDDVIIDTSCADTTRDKKWQVYNTASITATNTLDPITTSCDDIKCYQYGEFAYHESTERYPNNPEIWGALCNQKIRHHKFPDAVITHIHDGLNASKGFSESNLVFPIGVKVDHQSVVDSINQALTDGIITLEDKNRIVGYRIVRGNRFGNKSILAKGLLYDVWNYNKENITYYYPNYPYNDLREDVFLTEDINTYDDHDDPSNTLLPFRKTGRYTFHSPDTHFNSPELGEELKLETEEYGKSEGFFNYAEEQAKQKLLSTASYLVALSGGLVAMLTAVNEVREADWTVRGGEITTGTSPIPIITGSGTSPGGSVVTTTPGVGPNALQSAVNVPAIGTIYDNSTGIPIPPLGIAWEITKKTKQGTREQMFSAGAAVTGTVLDPVIGGAIGVFALANAISYKIGMALHETQLIVNLIKTFVPKKNYSIQYNSIGKYNNYKPVTNGGFKRRPLETYSYLKPEMAVIDDNPNVINSPNIFFNNWQRETSVYLKTDPNKSLFNNPTIVDNSRFNINCRGDNDCDFGNFNGKRYYKDISSYYASVKRYVPDQYGAINNIDYIDTGHCIFFRTGTYTPCDLSIFGGDTFISRFALKRKHSYFLQTRFGMMDEIDVNYSDLHNVAYPRYFFNNVTGAASEMADGGGILDLILDPATALGRPKSFLDSKTNKFFWQNGKMYLYSYGIPYFLVESDINVDYRYAENTKEKDFYPNTQDLNFWLQEKNVPISEDNHYFYNNTYSKQNKEHTYSQYAPDFIPSKMCMVNHPNRIIYSNGAEWLQFKANDFYDFPLSHGKLVGVDGIENDKVIVRSENTTQVFNAYVTLQTSTNNIQVGTGGMFQSKPQQYSQTTLGHAGSQHSLFLHTEYGHIWVDAKRGQVFNLSDGLDEISRYGMKNWFKENLPFQILKDFPTINIDNNFKGVGLCASFDKRFNRFILTKLDYKPRIEGITYEDNQFFYNEEVIELEDPKYFENRCWTVSYNFYTKAWISFHSYKPLFYIDGIDYFASGTSTGLWNHNLTNKSYQVFYGNVTPFTIQTITKAEPIKNTQNAVEYSLDTIRFHNDYDSFYANNITFNKAIVFNQSQNSGLLNLEVTRKNELDESIAYPITNLNSTTIRATNADGLWRFNQFYDLSVSRSNNIPLWLNTPSNDDKIINPRAINYLMPELDKKRIRGEYCRVRLTNDLHTNYKFIFKYLVNTNTRSYR